VEHPLFNRRDLTRERDHEQRTVHSPPAAEHAGLYELAEGLSAMNGLLERLLTTERADVAQLCVTDREPAQSVMRNFPVARACRYIVRRQGNGGLFVLAAGTPLEVVQPNEDRLGGQIVNAGANPVTLFLAADLLSPGSATPLTQGAPQIVVPANGTWNFLLGRLLWCGSVIALSTAGSSVSVAEV
jgi:hypothetical protein